MVFKGDSTIKTKTAVDSSVYEQVNTFVCQGSSILYGDNNIN